MRRLALAAFALLAACSAPPVKDAADTAAVEASTGIDGVVYVGKFSPKPDAGITEPLADLTGGFHAYAADFDLQAVAGQTCKLTIYYRIDGGVGGVDLDGKVAMIASTDTAPLADVPQMCERTVCPREDLDPADSVLHYQDLLLSDPWRADPGERVVRYVLKPSAAVLAGKIRVSASCSPSQP